MYVSTGTYVGAGGTPTVVTGVGFQPLGLFIKGENAADGSLVIAVGATVHTRVLTGTSAWDTQGTTAMGSDGFTVTGNFAAINSSGITYRFVAFGQASADCDSFTWTGDGTDNKNVGSIAFQPDVVFVIGAAATSNSKVRLRTDRYTGDSSSPLNSVAAADFIAGFTSSGITVGTANNVNTVVYYALCFKKVAGILSTVANYTGNGSDNRDIAHGLAATPVFTLISRTTNGADSAAIRFASQAGDNSMTVTTASAANIIQAVDGTNVQVGTSTTVNNNTDTYAMLNFGVAAPNVTVALTGVSSTDTPGSMTPSSDVPLTGVTATGSVGTMSVGSTDVALTGVTSTASPGTMGVNVTVALSGVTATGSVGTMGLGPRTVALTGVTAVGHAGSVGTTRAGTMGGILKIMTTHGIMDIQLSQDGPVQ